MSRIAIVTACSKKVHVKCYYDERRRAYVGRGRVIGRIAGQMLSVIYALLKSDQEIVAKLVPGTPLPPPVFYEPEIYHQHRTGQYRSPEMERLPKLTELPHH